MASLLGIELPPFASAIIAITIVVALLGLFYLVMRRVFGTGRLSSQNPSRARQPRLGIVDIYDLDRQRQLVLLRRDNVEHLLLIGGPNDCVVETNIVRASARAPLPTFEGVDRPAAPSSVASDLEAAIASATLAPPATNRPALEPARVEPKAEPASIERSAALERPAPAARPLAGDPAPRVAPVLRPSAPASSSVEPRAAPAPIPMAVPTPSVAPAVVAPVSSAAAPTAPAPAPQQPDARSEPAAARGSSASDDIARKLEEALQKPMSAVRPSAPVMTKPGPAIIGAKAAPDVSAQVKAPATAPAMSTIDGASLGAANVMGEEPSATEAPAIEMPTDKMRSSGKGSSAAPDVELRTSEIVVASPEPAPDMPAPNMTAADNPDLDKSESVTAIEEDKDSQGAATAADAKPAEKAPDEPAKSAAPDPFSVEAIEAEFARLLGRSSPPKS